MISPTSRGVSLALRDLREGAGNLHIWPLLGWMEIKQRYRRSVLGPFWLTISYGVMIGAMGPLYGRLLQQDISAFFPYLATGWVVWILIASLITEGCGAFIGAEGYIKQSKLPLSVHVLRVVWKNLIIFAHNVVIVVLVLLIYPPNLSWHVLLVPLGLLVVALNGVWFGILFGLLSARFRDIPQIAASVVQVLFFLTPVFWQPQMLGTRRWIADWNPLHHLVEVIRAPSLGQGPAWNSWLVVLGVTAAGYLVAFYMFSAYRARISYWV